MAHRNDLINMQPNSNTGTNGISLGAYFESFLPQLHLMNANQEFYNPSSLQVSDYLQPCKVCRSNALDIAE